MKSTKESSLNKLLSFVLIAVLLILVIGFAVNGWNDDLKEPNNGDGGNIADNADENNNGQAGNDNNDNNGDDQNDQTNSDDQPDGTTNGDGADAIIPPIEELPIVPTIIYKNEMTGLEVSEEQSKTAPLGFVVDPTAPLYGIASSDISIEFPIEDGTTRLLSYTTDTSLLWKIGSLAETRSFISSMSNFFGGIVISYGNDDIVKYSAWDTAKIELDISKYSECFYLENTLYVYTSKELTDIATSRATSIVKEYYKSAPYVLSSEKILGSTEANSIIIPYSDKAETELYYSEKSGKYLYYKAGNRKLDMLSGKNISFTNVFLLFSNATTYEKANGTELIIDTLGGGTGYYLTAGTLTELRWAVNENGELCFYRLNGEPLSANIGNSYIAYYKASIASSVRVN